MKIGLISDTHGKLRDNVLEVFAGIDVILHAGDIGSGEIISRLAALAPVHAVHGNTDDFDLRARYGESLELELEGIKIALVHGHQLGSPNPVRLRATFPQADVIVYGHTHMPLIDRNAKPLVINPGAAGPARFQSKPSVAILQLPQLELNHIPL